MAVVLGLFDDVHLLLDLIAYQSWTSGSYHQPVFFGIELATGIILGLSTVVFVVTPKPHGVTLRTWAGVLALGGVGAVSSLALLAIHVNEVDVSASGFRQDHFAVSTHDSFTFYNSGPTPITVCMGRPGAARAAPENWAVPASPCSRATRSA